MTIHNDDPAFIAKLKTVLDQSTDLLDVRTRARLLAARRTALAEAAPLFILPRWFLPVGAAATLAAVGAIGVWWMQPATPTVMAASVEDAELLFATDNIDLYQNLDFYRWLAAKGQSG